MKKQSIRSYFSRGEWFLWVGSLFVIFGSYLLFDRSDPRSLAASCVGVTSLILNAKGNPIGQALMVVFSLLYGWISFSFAYYGEMITYIGMTLPMAVYALIEWLRHPFEGGQSEVRVNRLKRKEIILLCFFCVVITASFYFILKALHTQNLLPSTVSVLTSFAAAYLTARRSAYFALAYAMNDLVLIVLWILAVRTDRSYMSVLLCFVMFLLHDLYGFVNWKRIQKRQNGVA